MPRLARGGRWVYGWAIVGPGLVLSIPPEAWRKYGFQANGEALVLRGSRTSRGFALANAARFPAHLATRVLGSGRFTGDGRVALPASAHAGSGDRLLVVLGSGHALGFLARGPIYQMALEHDDIEVFA